VLLDSSAWVSRILCWEARILIPISLLGSGGLFVVGGDQINFVGLGGCTADHMIEGLQNYCDTHVLRSPTTWLGIFLGGILTVILMLYRVKGAILIGIFLTSIISWPRPTVVTAFPHTPAGDVAFDFFKQVVAFHPLQRIGNAIDYNYGNGRVWYALVTMLYVDILDTTGTLYSMAKFAGLRDPVTLDFERSTIAYCVDAFSISMGALMGTSPVTAFVESATGIADGGKTGITAIVTGLAFLVSVFFAPIFASIPPWATGGALVIVGTLMIRNVREINWDYIGDAVPAFLTIIIIPLTYKCASLPSAFPRQLLTCKQHCIRCHRGHLLVHLHQRHRMAAQGRLWRPYPAADVRRGRTMGRPAGRHRTALDALYPVARDRCTVQWRRAARATHGHARAHGLVPELARPGARAQDRRRTGSREVGCAPRHPTQCLNSLFAVCPCFCYPAVYTVSVHIHSLRIISLRFLRRRRRPPLPRSLISIPPFLQASPQLPAPAWRNVTRYPVSYSAIDDTPARASELAVPFDFVADVRATARCFSLSLGIRKPKWSENK
jgi:hypothetical protein